MTRFDILLVVLLVLAIVGWPAGVVANRGPAWLLSAIVIVILLVLLLLGVVRA